MRNGRTATRATRRSAGFVRLAAVWGGVTATPLHFDKKIGIGAGGVVLVGDHLYGATPQGLLAIAWPTSAIVWQNRASGEYRERRGSQRC